MLEFNIFHQFNKDWQGRSPEQIALELASLNFETHHNCDSYHFKVGKNDFISPETGKLIRPEIKDNTSVQKKEKIIYENLYAWAKDNESGLSAWISPPAAELFPGTKIILHEIIRRGSEKFVLNRAILADIDTQKALDIANLFLTHSVSSGKEYSDPEKVRSQLFVMKEGISVIDLLNLFVDDPELIEQIENGQDLAMREEVLQKANKYSKKIKDGASSAEVYNSMVSDGFIGSFDISCPTVGVSFSEYVVGGSLVYGEYKRVKNCGKCGVSIDKLIKKGYKCSSCNGEYLGC